MPQSSKKFKKIYNNDGPVDDDKLLQIIYKNASYTANVVDTARKDAFPVFNSVQGYHLKGILNKTTDSSFNPDSFPIAENIQIKSLIKDGSVIPGDVYIGNQSLSKNEDSRSNTEFHIGRRSQARTIAPMAGNVSASMRNRPAINFGRTSTYSASRNKSQCHHNEMNPNS